jgi:hypothetical protein
MMSMMSSRIALAAAPLLLALVAAPTLAQPRAVPLAIIENDLESSFDLRCVLKRGKAPSSLLLGLRNGKAPLALRVGPSTLTLTRGSGGKSATLDTVRLSAARGESVPLVVQWRDGGLRVILDGRVILRRAGLGSLSEGSALGASGGDFSGAQCQPIEPVSFADDFMRAAGDAGQWETVSGEWKIRSASDPTKVANAFTYAAQGKPAIAVVGRWFWDDYRVSAAVRPGAGSTVGLVAFWQDAKNYVVFRWLPEGGPSARGREKQLWRIWRGQPSLLASAPGGYRAGQWYRLSLSAGGGQVAAGVDGAPVLGKSTDLFGQGKAGLYCSGDAGALVDDVAVEHARPSDAMKVVRGEAITPQFTREQSMENWAGPRAEWLPTSGAPNAITWHRGTFFGDHAVEVQAVALEPNHGKVTALLSADVKADSKADGKAESGYALVVSRTSDKAEARAVLKRAGKEVGRAKTVKLGADNSCALRLERVGKTVRAVAGGEVVATYADSAPLSGRRAGHAATGARIEPGQARVDGGNRYDYTFYRAPTDWYTSGGTWDMTSRWDCSPGWSWYGGWSERVAAIWNKHSFSGDFTADIFAACKRDQGGYQHPRDINITIAGDGRDLASGYSFVFGGWNNTATRLMRGTQVVAESTKYLLPKDYQNQAHHKWFNLRVERVGSLLSFFVDGELALQYRDPKPITGRRVALWTCGNGVIIARATLYYEKETPAEPVPALAQNLDWNTVPVENLGWIPRSGDATLRLEAVAETERGARLTASAPAVRALNVEGGGPFAIAPVAEPFDVLKTPRLSFDCRLERGTKVNLYVRARGVMHSLRLSGPAREMELEGTKVLGDIKEARADGRWHSVSVDLAALLKPLYPNEAEIRVEEIFLGSLSRDTYAQAGFGANPPGASYLVRGFALRGADNRVAKAIGPQIKQIKPGATRVAMAEPPLMASVPVAAPTPAAVLVSAPTVRPRGLQNVRVTYCQDADGGEFKPEMLNQPIAWKCFSRPLVTAKVDTLDFNWADKSPSAGLRPKYWSARFFGKILVPAGGDYIFALERLDDGARLFIDGKLVIDSWRVQAATTSESKPIALSPGAHDIRLDYSQGSGMGSLSLLWSGPGFGREVLSNAPQAVAVASSGAGAAGGGRR